jgi:transglutaminase-like putative cysteine protease
VAAQRQLFVNVTRAGLTLAAALSLARVLAGGSWFGAIAFAALLPPAIFAIVQLRRWNPFTALLLCGVTGVWLAMIVDDPSDTAAGLPTGTALSTLRTDISNAPHVLRSAVVPVNPVGAALVLAVVTTFVVALATEVVARRLDAPIGAVGPSIALFVAIAALGSGRWGPTTAVYALVVIAYLVALQHVEVAARRTWFQSGRARRSQAVTGGVAAGAIIVAFAIAAGPAFPGARAAAWINYRKLGVGKGSSELDAPSPFLTIRNKLTIDANREIFTVQTSDRQQYRWRAIALDVLNGKDDEWGLSATRGSTSQLPKPTHAPDAHEVTQTFHMNVAEDPYWLPAAYQPTKISVNNVETLPSSATLFLSKGSVAGVTYQVQSEVRNPKSSLLESVTMPELAPMAADTKLPPNFPDDVSRLADQIVADAKATTPYDKAFALQQFFQSDLFTYDTTVNYSSAPDALVAFVLHERKGFCEQFAAAFAEMARHLGLPTRIAVGYQPGTTGSDGLLHVRGADAHAWPEVWLGSTVGWYAFEPTKGRADPVTGQGAHTTPATTPSNTTPNSVGNTTPKTTPKTPPTQPATDPNSVKVNPPPKTAHAHHNGWRNTLLALAVLAGLAILAALAWLAALVVQALERTRRRRNAHDTRRRVLGAWAEALDLLTAAGVNPRPSATAVEFALRHAPAHGAGDAGPPLMDLARLHTAAMFAPEPPTDAEADEAWRLVAAIDAALRESLPRSTRWRTRLRRRPREHESREREREPVDELVGADS